MRRNTSPRKVNITALEEPILDGTTKPFNDSDNLLLHEGELLSAREEFVQQHNHCCLCGEELQFEHLVDFPQLTVLESANCCGCKIKLNKKLFTLN